MKILLIGFLDLQVERLSARFPSVEFHTSHTDRALDAEAVIVGHRAAFDGLGDEGVLEQYRGLRWVHIPGAGIEDYFGGQYARLPFTLTNGKIIQGPQVADHALALLLSLTRSLVYAMRGVPKKELPRPTELRGKKAVIVGCGGIGMSIAERASAFGMTITVVTEANFPYIAFIQERYYAQSLLEALPKTDVVFIAAPLTASTRHMFDRKALSIMKSTAYLINVSRGAIVDTDALVEALERRELGGAGLDVTDPEPLPGGHPLQKMKNVVLTPHIAGISDGHAQRHFELITTNLERFLAGLPLINVVDKSVGF